MNATFDVTAITLTAGLLSLLMAATVWGLLRQSAQATMVRLWSVGASLHGMGLLLTGGRDTLPDLFSYSVGGICASLAIQLHTIALRQHMGRPPALARFAMLWVLASLAYLAILATPDLRLRGIINCLLLSAGMGMLTWHGVLAARSNLSNGPRLMAWGGGLLLVALAVRTAALASGQTEVRGIYQSWDYGLLMVCITLTALYSNLGFLGMVLDITRRAESAAREAQVAETARRAVAERTADELRQLLQQRDTLAAERERLLQMLAHEIRQPLHNASGALQAAGQALRGPAPQAADVDQVAQRLGRAEAVLSDVRSVLDNTLAAATLLQRSAPLALQEIELEFLVALALGDLGEAQRARVQLVWHTDLRQAEVEPGLLRLALRNLLTNAFLHAGPAAHVQLQVAEQHEPPALLLRVVDDGPGLPSQVVPAAERRPGLGLTIVQQVMALHGGRLTLQPNWPHGLQAALVLPLPAA